MNPEDKVAMALYKRVGLYQTSRSYIDYDGYLNLRSYLPYVITYLLEAFEPIISKVTKRYGYLEVGKQLGIEIPTFYSE